MLKMSVSVFQLKKYDSRNDGWSFICNHLNKTVNGSEPRNPFNYKTMNKNIKLGET